MEPFARRAAVCVGLLAVVSTGCDSIRPAVLEPQFAPPRLQVARARSEPLCAVRVTELLDKRPDKLAIGKVAVRPVRSPANTGLWLNNIISELSFYGPRVQLAPDGLANQDAAPPLDLQVDLLRVSVNTIATALIANVELDVRYRALQSIEQHHYRGTMTLRNFTGRIAEVQQLVDESFDDTLAQMSTDVLRLCNQPAVQNR